LDIKGFDDVISDKGVDFVELVSLDALCGQNNNGVIVNESVSAYSLYGFYPIHERHHEVKDDDALESLFEFSETDSAVVRADDVKSLPFE